MKERDSKLREELWKSPEAEKLGKYCLERGIKAVMVDLDDMLTATRFREGRVLFYEGLKELTGNDLGMDEDEFMHEWYKMFYDLKPEFGVNPKTHEINSRLWVKRFGLEWENEGVQEVFGEMWSLIYEQVPDDIEGAWEMIQIFKGAGLDVILVTHGQEKWTDLKLSNWRGEFLKVHCIDVNGPKSVSEWLEVLDEHNLKPWEVIGAGDSWGSDIEPLKKLGVNYVIRAANQWGVDGKQIDGVVEVEGTRDVIGVLIRWMEDEGAAPGSRTQDLRFTKPSL